jgi:hypothetical protein
MEKEAPNPTKLMKFNIRLAAFTAAIFTKIVLTAAHGGPVNYIRGGPISIIWILAFLSMQYSHWPCGLAQEDFIEHNKP